MVIQQAIEYCPSLQISKLEITKRGRISQLVGQIPCSTLFLQYLTEQINSQNSRNSQLHCLRGRGTN